MTASELKELRQSTGLSQEKFAVQVLGVSGNTVCRWEGKKYRIDDLTADAIKMRVRQWLKHTKA